MLGASLAKSIHSSCILSGPGFPRYTVACSNP